MLGIRNIYDEKMFKSLKAYYKKREIGI